MNGKGSDRRPAQVSPSEFAKRWDAVFPPKRAGRKNKSRYKHLVGTGLAPIEWISVEEFAEMYPDRDKQPAR